MTGSVRSVLALDRRTADAVVRGHPWVYRDQLPKGHRLSAGDEVELRDPRGAFLARALVDPGSPIPIRVWTRDPASPSLPSALGERLAVARRLRERCVDLGAVTGYRLVHGEGDGLPGLVVDRYADVLVVRTYCAAWEPHLGALVAALRAQGGAGVGAIVRAAADAERDVPEGAEEARPGTLWGRDPGRVEIREGPRTYPVTPGRGQKTGFFLDQRPARDAAAGWARPGDRALNLFAFTGGFSVALALGGAREVTSVDVSRGALAAAEEAFVLSGLDPASHRFVAQDAFAFLEEAVREGRQWEVVVSDPPAFAHRNEQVPAARQAYGRLHRLLARIVAPSGLLVTASCTARFTESDLEDAARVGLAATRRDLRVVWRGGAGPDHPVPAGFPEGRYLKVLAGVVAG